MVQYSIESFDAGQLDDFDKNHVNPGHADATRATAQHTVRCCLAWDRPLTIWVERLHNTTYTPNRSHAPLILNADEC
ncbi:hypothetical protein BBBOND_0405140 [Babesia bigemina]|uniref:Uncharacterized protein n=1 Tax=Babesia bigemina TaxID=5866 RepID=A0A061DE70_BABBI|nr:hypothetical protein BBBOND_0405140 [Babesia bigemina]CDR98029.1 hypothetical protein BBBOND_0405140 [Babesia bigemina]|eukprot:XP_012770215.1 hypothetical protein BBBOND_0405140 [Babesia bigemina]